VSRRSRWKRTTPCGGAGQHHLLRTNHARRIGQLLRLPRLTTFRPASTNGRISGRVRCALLRLLSVPAPSCSSPRDAHACKAIRIRACIVRSGTPLEYALTEKGEGSPPQMSAPRTSWTSGASRLSKKSGWAERFFTQDDSACFCSACSCSRFMDEPLMPPSSPPQLRRPLERASIRAQEARAGDSGKGGATGVQQGGAGYGIRAAILRARNVLAKGATR
jgi:hypothetical protein